MEEHAAQELETPRDRRPQLLLLAHFLLAPNARSLACPMRRPPGPGGAADSSRCCCCGGCLPCCCCCGGVGQRRLERRLNAVEKRLAEVDALALALGPGVQRLEAGQDWHERCAQRRARLCELAAGRTEVQQASYEMLQCGQPAGGGEAHITYLERQPLGLETARPYLSEASGHGLLLNLAVVRG